MVASFVVMQNDITLKLAKLGVYTDTYEKYDKSSH